MNADDKTLNHSKFLLIYHIIFVIKYRKKLLMVTSVPKVSPLQIVRKLKQETTVRIWKQHPELKKQFWKEKTFWSDGYFCCSIGNASIEKVRKYIEEQG